MLLIISSTEVLKLFNKSVYNKNTFFFHEILEIRNVMRTIPIISVDIKRIIPNYIFNEIENFIVEK